MNDYPVARNTVLLAASLTCLSGMLQLAVAVATTSLVLVTGIEGILGLGPAIFLVAGAVSALPAGRLMDRLGRVPVLAGGFGLGIVGCLVTALACAIESAALLVAGFVGVGGAMGIALLARTAAGDMYPPERRARGISLVLFGAVFGAILGPTVFSPLFSKHHLDADALVVPWLAAAGIVAIGMAVVLAVRPDPSTLARARAHAVPEEPAAPLADPPPAGHESVHADDVRSDHREERRTACALGRPSCHDREAREGPEESGRYVVGDLIDRLGRRAALVGGLGVMGLSTLALAWTGSVLATGVALFGLGLGWSLSYVAATSELVDLARPSERGRLVGFNDLSRAAPARALRCSEGSPTATPAATASRSEAQWPSRCPPSGSQSRAARRRRSKRPRPDPTLRRAAGVRVASPFETGGALRKRRAGA